MKLRVLVVALLAGVLGLGAWWAFRSDRSAPIVERSTASPVDASKPDAPLAGAELGTDRATIEDTAAAPTEAALSPTHRIIGRVVDEQRLPVAGAEVSLPHGEGTKTGGDGTFALEVHRADEKPTRQEGLFARDTRGRCVFRPIWLTPSKSIPPSVIDVGTLVLAEGFALSVSVLDAGAPAAGALVQVELGHAREPLCERQVDANGHLSLDLLPRGPVHLTARLPERQGHAMVFVPEEREVVVQLEPLGEAEVLVTDSKTGAGVGNALLGVSEMIFVPAPLTPDRGQGRGEYLIGRPGPGDGTRTDAEGRARCTGLAQNTRYYVNVDAAGYVHFPTPPASGARIQAGAAPVTIQLEPFAIRSVRWPVVAGEVPPPPAGSVITFRHREGIYERGHAPALPTSGHMEGSLLLADNVAGRAFLIAEAPDGSLAQLHCEEGAEQGDQTEFRRPRRVEVHIHDQAGHPIAGAQAIARNQGNNDMCDWATSDAQGVAVLARLHGDLAEIHVRRTEEGGFGERVASVDLERGDASIEAVLSEPTWSRGRLTLLVDGVPRLPPRFGFSARDRVRLVSEEPTSGELLLELANAAAGQGVQVWVSAPGFAMATTTFQFPADGSEPSEQLALERTGLLIAHVTPPEEGRVSILPQHVDAQGAWANAPEIGLYDGLSRSNGPDGTYLFPGLTRGRWRVLDEVSGASSEPFDVVAVSAPVEVSLDLSSIEWASGRVEVDDPAELARVRVRVVDPRAEPTKSWRPGSSPPEGAYTRDGRFRVQVPGDRDVTLVPWHPWLVPDPERGSVVLHGGREDVVLRLVAGDELRIPLANIDPNVRTIRAARYAGDPTGNVLEWHHVPVADGVARMSVAKGTWTLWIDPIQDFAPLLLSGISVDGVTELQPVELHRGSSIRVRILVPKDQSTPRIAVFASSIDEPEYGRVMNSDGEDVAVLSGLGPGRFKVHYRSVMGDAASVEKEVELDGVHDLEFEYDLR